MRIDNFYVYFNSKNEIVSVGGRKNKTSSFRYAEFPRGIVEGFVVGTKKMSDYLIVEDRQTGKLRLSKKVSHEIVVRTIDNMLYKVPTSNEKYDIKIQNNTKENRLIFFLNVNLRNVAEDKSQVIINGVTALSFFFTKKDDPHVLKKHVLVSIDDLLQNNVISDYVKPLNNISVFTKRIYENYLYEEI